MSIRLGLVYTDEFGNHISYVHISNLCSCFLQVYVRSYQIKIIFKLIYFTHIWDLNGYYHSKPEWTRVWWQWRGTPYSPAVQNWSISIKCSLFSYSAHPRFIIGYPSVRVTISVVIKLDKYICDSVPFLWVM